jgi:hypothetical protein
VSRYPLGISAVHARQRGQISTQKGMTATTIVGIDPGNAGAESFSDGLLLAT